MSMIYCEKHHRQWDSDRLDFCPDCENEPETDLLIALRNLYGLVQLFTARDDIPQEAKDATLANYRFIEAGVIIKKYEGSDT